MSTYYGFNEREKLKPIDWNSITRDINQKIDTELERRDTIKEEVEEFGREYRKKLNEAPMGKSDTLNNWVGESVGQLSSNFKLIDDQLKSGRLRYKDYIRLRANMNEGVDTMIGLAKNANAIYTDKYERMERDDSQGLEQWGMNRTLGLIDFANSAPVIDPETGIFSIAKRDKNGNIIPGSVISITNLRRMASWKGDKFDVNTWADNLVDKTAKTKFQAFRDAPYDLRSNENYQEWREDSVNSLNPFQVAEVLYRVSDYDFTDSRAVRDSNPGKYILVNGMKNGVPNLEFTNDQEDEVKAIARRYIDVRMNKYFGPITDRTTGSGSASARRYPILDAAITGDNTEAFKSAVRDNYEKEGMEVQDVVLDPGKSLVVSYIDENARPQSKYIDISNVNTYNDALNVGLGSAIGLTAAQIGQENKDQLKYSNVVYRDPSTKNEDQTGFGEVEIKDKDYAALPKSLGSLSGVGRTMIGKVFYQGDLNPDKLKNAEDAIDNVIARTGRVKDRHYQIFTDINENIIIKNIKTGESFTVNTKDPQDQGEDFRAFIEKID